MRTFYCSILALIQTLALHGADLTITSFDHQGRLTWSSVSSNSHFRVEWASEVGGPWTNFHSLSSLDAIESKGPLSTIRVPMFYRVLQTPTKSATLEGLYRYTGFDTNGNLLIIGWWTLGGQTNRSLGIWTLGYAGSDPDRESIQNVGPQIGQGQFEGQFDADQVSVNLNPGWADNNIFVNGRRTNGGYSGQWSWSTFPGPRTSGNFFLERIAPNP